jgi:nucleotide-binding universal stress UspA family protein
VESWPGFRRILVAVDGSRVSLRAVDYAARLAKEEKAELMALHVVPSPPFEIAESPAAYYDEARRNVKKWLKDVERVAATHGKTIESEILVDASSVPDAILGYAETHQVDLIVTGHRGRTPSTKMLIGSVASAVVEYASCPVLVVR